jgi:hypothetical protein
MSDPDSTRQAPSMAQMVAEWMRSAERQDKQIARFGDSYELSPGTSHVVWLGRAVGRDHTVMSAAPADPGASAWPCQACWIESRAAYEPARIFPAAVDEASTYCDRHRVS